MADIGTKAHDVRKALANDAGTGKLQVWAGLSTVNIYYAWPGEVDDNELIWLAGISWPDDQWATATRSTRDELFEIGLLMETRGVGKTQQQTSERLITLFEEVQKALRADVRNPTGVEGVYQVEVIPKLAKEGVWADEGRWADMTAVIRCKARH